MAPSHTEKENCRKFAKFCFKVIKNECSNIKRAAGIRKEYDATGEEPVEYLLELLAHEDTYTMENLILVVDGKPCAVESEMLFEALKSLPDDQRKVILYDFWLELKDREIAERLEVTVRTVYNLRQVHHIKPLAEGGDHSENNLMSLCSSCHAKIHAERGDRWHNH